MSRQAGGRRAPDARAWLTDGRGEGQNSRVIVRLYHADKNVRSDLLAEVRSRNGFVLATQLQGPRNVTVEGRTPFKEILGSGGSSLDLIVVIDEGKPEGMWRDPFGDLCDRLFQDKKDASAATSGYVLIRAGQAMAYFRKALWDPFEDAEEVTAYLARAAPTLFKPFVRPPSASGEPPVPKPFKPKPKKTPIINPAAPNPGFTASARTTTDIPSVVVSPELTEEVPPRRDTDPGDKPPAFGLGGDADDTTEVALPQEAPAVDPWMALGIHQGASLDEVKKAYRALITQYHPDKVAHLAPEFKKLAEEKTRELNEAWTLLEKQLSGGR